VDKPEKALIIATWAEGDTEVIPVKYYPTEVTFDKAAQIAEIAIPGLDSPLLQFVHGQNERLTLDLFFDTTEDGMGAGATAVTVYTDRIYGLVKIVPDRHAPPVCQFIWLQDFPGSQISPRLGNQRRDSFKCVVESVRQKFTLFSPDGVPLRATLSVVLREYKTLNDQLGLQNPNSPDRTQGRILQQGETLSSVAARHYLKPGEWRRIADANGIYDPRRTVPGTFLTLPPIR
jgi:Contractile injection system tube protein/LysM domain